MRVRRGGWKYFCLSKHNNMILWIEKECEIIARKNQRKHKQEILVGLPSFLLFKSFELLWLPNRKIFTSRNTDTTNPPHFNNIPSSLLVRRTLEGNLSRENLLVFILHKVEGKQIFFGERELGEKLGEKLSGCCNKRVKITKVPVDIWRHSTKPCKYLSRFSQN